MFVSFEGIDGSGKTTQAKLLAKQLGDGAVSVREPGGTRAGESLRAVLLDAEAALGDRAELLTFLAARAQLLEEVIEPALAAGRPVICDRFSDSTVAYQGAARRMGVEQVRDLCETATGGRWPDLTVYLRIDPAKAYSQLALDDRFESEGLEFQRTIAGAYDDIAAREPERVRVVDAGGSVKQVQARVMEAIRERARG